MVGGKSFAHDYYVSICTIDYNMKNKSLELTFKLIAHDIEKSIAQNQKIDLRLGSEKEYEQANKVLEEYISRHFQMEIADSIRTLKFIGKEVELDESLYLYFEMENIGSVSDLTIRNDILCEMYDAQENILHLNISKAGQSVVFNKNITSKEIKI